MSELRNSHIGYDNALRKVSNICEKYGWFMKPIKELLYETEIYIKKRMDNPSLNNLMKILENNGYIHTGLNEYSFTKPGFGSGFNLYLFEDHAGIYLNIMEEINANSEEIISELDKLLQKKIK